jgi:hypothetical protein
MWPTVDPVTANPVVTAVRTPHTIKYVPIQTVQTLTKRRAVDFCRVATAMCRPMAIVACR